jgi:hypothetical protein
MKPDTTQVATRQLKTGTLGPMLAALHPDPAAIEAALAEILRTAAALSPEDSGPDITAHLGQWEPVIAAIATACQPGHQPSPELTAFLDERAKQPDWSALVAVLRRILAGERAEAALLPSLDEIDTAIARETLSRIAQGK